MTIYGLQLPLMCSYLNLDSGKPSFPETQGLHVEHAGLFYDFWRADCMYSFLVLLFLHASGDVEGGFFQTVAPW